MIFPISNQPLGFSPSRLQGCLCPEPSECLLIDTTDPISVQFVYEPCLSDQLLASPNFEDSSDWLGPTWTISTGSACLQGVSPFSPLTELSFTPTNAAIYRVIVTFAPEDCLAVTCPPPQMRVTFGGALDEQITSAGEYTWTVQTFSPAPLTFLPLDTDRGRGCVQRAEIYEITPELLVEARQNGSTVADMAWSISTMGNFVFEEDRVTITFDLTDLTDDGDPVEFEGCYTFRVTDTCHGYDGETQSQYESQCVAIADYTDCTLVLKACNSGDGIGFVGNFEPQMRVRAKLVRPVYEYTVKEERFSNGRINRYYADRQRVMELRIDRTGEYGHEFLSTLSLYDHVYIGTQEYSVEADGYEPGYADVWESYGGILLKVRPAQELARKVRCEEDQGGCAPPPNYWVQGTGPNTNYVLQSANGERILLY